MPARSTSRLGWRVASGKSLRRLGFALVVVAALAWEVHAIFLAEYGTPLSRPAKAAYLAGEIAGATRVSQTFGVRAAGFCRIAVRPRRWSGPAGSDVVFELRHMDGRVEPPVFRLVRPAAAVLASSRYAIDFPPIEESARRLFRFEVSMPNAPPGGGIGLLANRESSYPNGALFVDGREQWGDLVFETSATRATAFASLEHRLRDKPTPLRSRWTLGAAFVLCNWALLAFVYGLAVADPSKATPEVDGPEPRGIEKGAS